MKITDIKTFLDTATFGEANTILSAAKKRKKVVAALETQNFLARLKEAGLNVTYVNKYSGIIEVDGIKIPTAVSQKSISIRRKTFKNTQIDELIEYTKKIANLVNAKFTENGVVNGSLGFTSNPSVTVPNRNVTIELKQDTISLDIKETLRHGTIKSYILLEYYISDSRIKVVDGCGPGQHAGVVDSNDKIHLTGGYKTIQSATPTTPTTSTPTAPTPISTTYTIELNNKHIQDVDPKMLVTIYTGAVFDGENFHIYDLKSEKVIKLIDQNDIRQEDLKIAKLSYQTIINREFMGGTNEA